MHLMGASTHRHLHLENFNFPGCGYRTSEPTLKYLVCNQSAYWQRTHHLQHPCSVGDCRHYILLLHQRNCSCCATWPHYSHRETAASIMSNNMHWVWGNLKSHISYRVQRRQKLFQSLEQQRNNEIRDAHSCASTSKCNCQHDDPSAKLIGNSSWKKISLEESERTYMSTHCRLAGQWKDVAVVFCELVEKLDFWVLREQGFQNQSLHSKNLDLKDTRISSFSRPSSLRMRQIEK